MRGKGKYSGVETTSFYIVPRKAQITYGKSTAKGKMTLKYKKQPRVSGYEIWYSARKNGTYYQLNPTTKTYTKITGPSGKAYYFKVRAYKTIGATRYYGSFSNVKKVRFR